MEERCAPPEGKSTLAQCVCPANMQSHHKISSIQKKKVTKKMKLRCKLALELSTTKLSPELSALPAVTICNSLAPTQQSMTQRHSQSAAFVQRPFFVIAPRARPLSSTCTRRPLVANINETSDRAREDEIAAKIAKLRKQKRLKSQASGKANESVTQTSSSSQQKQAEKPYSFNDLPDWKKEQVLSSQIQEAEQFFNKGSSLVSDAESNQTEGNAQDYQPKVSTWGVFPRPDNISRTYGGGKRIRKGGVDLESEQSKARDEAVRKRLQQYRKTRGIDMEKEEQHREQIENALEQSEKLMRRTLPYEAISCLEAVVPFTSDRSRLGGKVSLSLALAYESVGRREDARQMYVRLRSSPFAEISSKAKQLMSGLDAMQQLGVEDETQKTGYRVMRFSLPDMNAQVEKRYETVVRHEDEINTSTEKISLGTNIALVSLMTSPLVLLLILEWLKR